MKRSHPQEAYLILEGFVNIETKDGLKLNKLGVGEILVKVQYFLIFQGQLQQEFVIKN